MNLAKNNDIQNINLNGHSARYLHLSNYGKPALVFLPGALQDIDALREYNKGLSEDFDYYILELPGTGSTPYLPAHKTIGFLAECLDIFISDVVKKPFNLVACSYATAIALDYGAYKPNMLDGLILAGSMLNIPESEWPNMLLLLRQCYVDQGAFASGFTELVSSDKCDSKRQAVIKKAVARKTKQYSENQIKCFVYNTLRLMTYHPEHLELITTPTLCFTGEHDPYTTPVRCIELVNKLPNATFTSLRDTDHLFHVDKPNETIALIRQFLHQSLSNITMTPGGQAMRMAAQG